MGIGGSHGKNGILDFKKNTGKEGFLFIRGSGKGDEVCGFYKIPASNDAVILVVHFLDIREFHLVPGGELGYIGSRCKGDHIFMVPFFHSNRSCRHHADGTLQLGCCNNSNAFFFNVCSTGCFDTYAVIIGLDKNFSLHCGDKETIIGIGCNFVLCCPLYAVQCITELGFFENDFHGSSFKNDDD